MGLIESDIMELIVKLDQSTIDSLVTGITAAIKKTPCKEDRLYNMTELSKILNISRNTLKTKDLPCNRTSKKGRKLYSLPEVRTALKLNN